MREKVERLNFDPVKEVNYLRNFSGDLKKQQLEKEIETSLAELLLSEYSHDYWWDGGKIIDKNTGMTARDLAEKCDFESRRVGEVEGKLKRGDDLVVSVSPKNETLDYPDDMVDFWKRGEGEKLTLMRFKVKMSQTELDDFEAVDKEGYGLADLIRMLNLVKENKGTSVALIERITRSLIAEFEKENRTKVYLDAEIITRLYVAIRLEVEEQSRTTGMGMRNNAVTEALRIKNYLYGELETERVTGGGCGGSSLSGQFAGEGIIIIKTADGVSFRKGKTEGLTFCSQCGCWYSGEKCPICNK
jgi:hypothetical protein